ncbi:MAG: BMP family ABC transporter substrate-binding protein [Chlorobiaceae bacterium]|nr:BMP family ABC transporter substrate-binding protein [Chlorobiaceae bacterium]NTV26446.1 BMP family ABC transporter substrate-binding protein [Chlorobiaceae bacterium]
MIQRALSSAVMRAATFMLLFSTLLAGCSGKPSKSGASGAYKVGLVFDVGGRGDKSFNDAAYNGLELAKKKLGIEFDYIEPQGEGADREAALRQMAADPDVKMIVGVGLLFTDDITAIAREFPDKKFVCIDYNPQPGAEIPTNLSGIVFEEKKGSFLAGAIAALTSKTGTIGFIGGMDSNIIRKFESGYTEGAKFVKPDIRVVSGFVGMTGSAFNDPAKGKELALGQFSRGADIIYQAAGASGLGVIEAARETGKYVICTDMDQEYLAPGRVLTSMTKSVDKAVLATVEDGMHDKFQGGKQRVFGLDGRFTDYVYNDRNASLVGDATHERVEQIRSDILSGKIKVSE